jgi:hypothetical protein
VYPNLAFNSSAISTAMKIGDSTVRYDVAKEAFLIRGESLDSVNLSKLVIANEMSAHGFHLEIEGESPAPPSFDSSPSVHQSQRSAAAARTPVAPAPAKLSAANATAAGTSAAMSALPTPILRSTESSKQQPPAAARAAPLPRAGAEKRSSFGR